MSIKIRVLEFEKKFDKRRRLATSIVLIFFGFISQIHIIPLQYLNLYMGLASKFGEMIGYSLWLMIFAILIWKYVLRRREQYWLIIFALLFFVFSLSIAFQTYIKINQEKEIFDKIKNSAEKLLNEQKVEKIESASKNQKEQLYILTNNYQQRIQEHYQLFQSKLLNTYANVLNEDKIKDLTSITKTKKELNKTLKSIDQYESVLENEFQMLIKAVSGLDIDLNFKIGLNRGKEQSEEFQKEYLQIQRRTIYVYNEILNLLTLNIEDYWIIDGVIKFNLQNNVDVFNRHMHQLLILERLEFDLIQRYNKEAMEKLNKLNNQLE